MLLYHPTTTRRKDTVGTTPSEMMKQVPPKYPYSAEAQEAVRTFEEAARAEDLLQRKLVAHENAAMRVPEKDRAWYMEETEKIRRKYEDKQETRPALYESRLSKLLRRKPKARRA